MGEIRRDLRPERIREECESSLRRLGVERIDLYQFHWPDQTGTPVEDSWGRITSYNVCYTKLLRQRLEVY